MVSSRSTHPARRGFDRRAFVATLLTVTGLGLPVTGVANHLYQSAPMHFGRHTWMAAHNAFGLLFLVFATWHVVLNRRRLVQYLCGLVPDPRPPSRETLCAVGLVGVVLTLFIGHAFVL